jgi:hypothetical protein
LNSCQSAQNISAIQFAQIDYYNLPSLTSENPLQRDLWMTIAMAQSMGQTFTMPTIDNCAPPSMIDENNSTDWPKFGRDVLDSQHIPFAIAGHLAELGLETWTHHLLTFLSRYDGLESRIEHPQDVPLVAVRDLLAEFTMYRQVVVDKTRLKQSIAQRISRLLFVYYRVSWVNPRTQEYRYWNPLREKWLDFVDDNKTLTSELRTWSAHRPNPPPMAIECYLMGIAFNPETDPHGHAPEDMEPENDPDDSV